MVEQVLTPKRGLLILALAAAHLVFVALGAFEVRVSEGNFLGKALARYAAFTGADSNFGFFAPFVGSDLRLVFEVTEHGRTTEELFQLGNNRELALRISNLTAMYWFEDEDLRRSLSASLAGKVFAKHPGAESVAVRVDILTMPSMDAYRDGDRPSWGLHYRAKFVPRASLREPQKEEADE